MPSRDLPARPHLEHLKNEAKALRAAFLEGAPDAADRVRAVLGPRQELKLTEAQRIVAREYGFPSWARLRVHVQAARGIDQAVAAFLRAVHQRDTARALAALSAEPRIGSDSVHVAAVLGRAADVRRLVQADPACVRERTGPSDGDPLLWLCYSPFHGESAERDQALAATARALLDAGADPNTKDSEHGVPALYAVTGATWAPSIARMLLEAGANPTDGESVFHAAEHFHQEALELLLSFGADLNHVGDWGNTALYFLLRHWNVAEASKVRQGFEWLLDHGADPNVPSGRVRETALHVAARRGQSPDVVQLLLERGADVTTARADGRSAWGLARRGGHDELVALLEVAGAQPETLTPSDALLEACARGDVAGAERLSSPAALADLDPTMNHLLPEAADRGRLDVIRAALRAGLSVATADDYGATALHLACIRGRAAIARLLLEHGADFGIYDPQHQARPMGWACFGADVMPTPDGDYAGCVCALLDAGDEVRPDDHQPRHPGIRAVLAEHRDG